MASICTLCMCTCMYVSFYVASLSVHCFSSVANCHPKISHEKFPEVNHSSFKLRSVVSSVMKSHTVPLLHLLECSSALPMVYPVCLHYLLVSHLTTALFIRSAVSHQLATLVIGSTVSHLVALFVIGSIVVLLQCLCSGGPYTE